MKHAYLIMAHTDFPLLQHLMNELDDSRNDIFVHIDAKSAIDGAKLSVSKANLYLTSNRLDAAWADFSLVEIELLLLNDALKKGPYEYYHLLSGADIPIKSQDYIHSFCENNIGKEFIAFSSINPVDLRWRANHHFIFRREFRRKSFVLRIIRGLHLRIQDCFWAINKDIEFKKGSQWFSITQSFAEYVVGSSIWIKTVFEKTFAPDEMFLQTLVWHSPYRAHLYSPEEGSNGNMRFIRWKDCAPEQIKEELIPEMVSSCHWFARKCSSIKVAESVSRYLTDTTFFKSQNC